MGTPEYVADSWTVSPWEGEHNHDFEWHAEVLDGRRLNTMRRMANAWEWHEGHGNGGENPHRHPDGWVPVYRDSPTPEFVILVLQGQPRKYHGGWDPDTGHEMLPGEGLWYVVKADYQQVSAREFNRLTHRAVARRLQKNPVTRTSYEVPWLWLEPIEMSADYHVSGEDAVQAAKAWAAELRASWSLEWNPEDREHRYLSELLVEPAKMAALKNFLVGDAQDLLEDALDEVMKVDGLRKLAGEFDRHDSEPSEDDLAWWRNQTV